LNKIKELRTEKGYTLENVASELGVSKQYIYKLEHGIRNIPLKRAVELARIFNVSIDELIGKTS
jgi:transcriptional regulator with XRE-family HTH domain